MRFLILLYLIFINSICQSQVKNDTIIPFNKNKIAISLSYDDALNSQLDNAVPALNAYNFKASFYIVPSSGVVQKRMEEWRNLTKKGHELGNHSVYHPCRASLPNRDWVASYKDLDHYSLKQIKEELKVANTLLHAIDGKTERTFTPPCLDSLINGQNYLNEIGGLFKGIKGVTFNKKNSITIMPSNISGKKLIEEIKSVDSNIKLINIIFHGIGGDYLSISDNAHKELLKFLHQNKEIYWVDSYINIIHQLKNR